MRLARGLLWLLGWRPLDVGAVLQHPRLVSVFSHTSYFDFVVFFLYICAYPEVRKRCNVMIRHDFFNWAGPLLRRLGGIPGPAKRGGGKVQEVVGELQNKSEFFFLISPKGSRTRRAWFSGYWHIAAQLNVPVNVVGLDFVDKKVVISPSYHPRHYAPQQMEAVLKDELRHIVPLHPQDEVVPIRIHDGKQRGVFRLNRLVLLILLTATGIQHRRSGLLYRHD